jgi:integrase
VFPNTQGQHMHHGSLYKVFRPARKTAGRPDLRWHDLRHTGPTNAAPYATTRELMTFMGHSTMSAALIYQHAVEDRMAGLSAAMNTQIPAYRPTRTDSRGHRQDGWAIMRTTRDR